jgi:hypothetical protein
MVADMLQVTIIWRSPVSVESDLARQALSSIWAAQGEKMEELDEECNPNKVCRNMKDVTFEGYIQDEGASLATAWRETLIRDGKLGAGSIGSLVQENKIK